MANSNWLCIQCGTVLGEMIGGELRPDGTVPGNNLITRGPNLVVVCPHCGATKVFYTSDPIVRAMYQLVDALATSMARRTVAALSEDTIRDVMARNNK